MLSRAGTWNCPPQLIMYVYNIDRKPNASMYVYAKEIAHAIVESK
jgi:hypothetical protein